LLPGKSGCIVPLRNVGRCKQLMALWATLEFVEFRAHMKQTCSYLQFGKVQVASFLQKIKLVSCLAAVLWLVQGKFTFCRAVGETEAVATLAWPVKVRDHNVESLVDQTVGGCDAAC